MESELTHKIYDLAEMGETGRNFMFWDFISTIIATLIGASAGAFFTYCFLNRSAADLKRKEVLFDLDVLMSDLAHINVTVETAYSIRSALDQERLYKVDINNIKFLVMFDRIENFKTVRLTSKMIYEIYNGLLISKVKVPESIHKEINMHTENVTSCLEMLSDGVEHNKIEY